MTTQVLQHLAHSPVMIRAAIKGVSAFQSARLNAGFGEVIRVDELIGVFAVIEYGDVLSLVNPLEEDLKNSQPAVAQDGAGPEDCDIQTVSGVLPAQVLSGKFGFAILFHWNGNSFFRHGIRLGYSVNRARRNENDLLYRPERTRLQEIFCSIPVHAPEQSLVFC